MGPDVWTCSQEEATGQPHQPGGLARGRRPSASSSARCIRSGFRVAGASVAPDAGVRSTAAAAGRRVRVGRVRGAHSTIAGRWCAAAAAAAAAASAGACAWGAGSAGECACSAALGGRWRALFWCARRPASCE